METKINDILAEVAGYFNLTKKDIISKKKYGELAEARHVFSYIAREALGLSWKRIAHAVKRTDHSTAIYGYNKGLSLLGDDEMLREFVQKMIAIYHNPNTNRVYKSKYESVFDKYGHKCMVCGFDEFVELAYRIPPSQGGTDTPENILILCPNHRKLYANGKLKIKSEVKNGTI